MPRSKPLKKHQYWLVKQEPEAYSWANFVADGRTSWTGVRNFQARNNLRSMRVGDRVLYYHSVTGKAVVGIAEVVKEAYPDTTSDEGDWVCVDLAPVRPFKQSVSLAQIKADPLLSQMALVRQSRLSVTPLSSPEYERLLELGGKK